MLGPFLSALTLLATIKIALDIVLSDPELLKDALIFLLCGSALSAYLLFFQPPV